jgi:signal transduction histidine kinase
MKSKLKIPISYKIGLMAVTLSTAIFFLFFLYNHFVNYPLLLKSTEVQIDEVQQLFRDDIAIMLSFGDNNGVGEVLGRVTSLENIVGIYLKSENIEFKAGVVKEEWLKSRSSFSLIDDSENPVFLHSSYIDNSSLKLFYSANNYLETMQIYNNFFKILTVAIAIFGTIFFISIRKMVSFFEALSEKLQTIDLSRNFQPITFQNLKTDDEREHILRGVNELLQRIQSEVSKSREKDRLMFQQARLAQMGEMIGNIAHQWRQPLNEISLLFQSFEMAYFRGKVDDVFIEKRVLESEKLVQKMSQTIDDFREFFNPNKEKADFDIGDSIDDAVKLLQASFDNSSIQIIKKYQRGIELFGFKNEFEQVLLNILSNSKDVLQNSENSRWIEIGVENHKERLFISLYDSGGGIKEDILERVFEPYFSTKEQGKGTGIGLYMSKAIVESMSGEIAVVNREFGAEFTIKFPIKRSLNE